MGKRGVVEAGYLWIADLMIHILASEHIYAERVFGSE